MLTTKHEKFGKKFRKNDKKIHNFETRVALISRIVELTALIEMGHIDGPN